MPCSAVTASCSLRLLLGAWEVCWCLPHHAEWWMIEVKPLPVIEFMHDARAHWSNHLWLMQWCRSSKCATSSPYPLARTCANLFWGSWAVCAKANIYCSLMGAHVQCVCARGLLDPSAYLACVDAVIDLSQCSYNINAAISCFHTVYT